MRKIVTLMLIILTFFGFVFDTNAATVTYDYNKQFTEIYGMTALATARSPFRTSSGADDFAVGLITGPNNQPRYLLQKDGSYKTDVHNGTDFVTSPKTLAVYPMFNAQVLNVKEPTTTSNTGYVTLQYDIDNNGTYDNYYVQYMHINPIDNMKPGDKYAVSISIGAIDIAKSYAAHLHLQEVDSSGNINSNSKKLYRYFTTVQNWGYGYYLEFLAGDYNSPSGDGNNFYISVNSFDNGVNSPPARVEFYYKIGSSGTWKQGPNMSVYLASNNRYTINLKTATGAITGQTVYYYLAAIRTNGSYNPDYNWGLWPQYYKLPPKSPSTFINTSKTIYCKSHIIK